MDVVPRVAPTGNSERDIDQHLEMVRGSIIRYIREFHIS